MLHYNKYSDALKVMEFFCPPKGITIHYEWRNDNMVKHVILWNLKESLSDAEKEEVKKGAKEGLENLIGKIPGLIDIKVNTVGLPSSNADMMLDSTFESAEALKGYSKHPEHVAVADSKVRPFTASRVCMDYEV